MSGQRASIFEEEELDLSGFQPVQRAVPRSSAEKAAIRQVAEEKGFPSREAASPIIEPEARKPRRHTTGRNRQLNMKVTEDTVTRFYALADSKGWVLGEAFAHAVAALERELGQGG